MEEYNVLFYETAWYRSTIEQHPNIVHAFGVNTSIFHKMNYPRYWDYITVGAFADWKRQGYMAEKTGRRLAVGQVQRNNLKESLGIVAHLVGEGVCVSDSVSPEELAIMYNMSKTVFIPAASLGGGERAVLEGRACGCDVEIKPDNLKLAELVTSPIWNEDYYASQLKKGIDSCLG